jgi:hypothetical protein
MMMDALIIFYQEILVPSATLTRINLAETKHRDEYEAKTRALAPNVSSLSQSLKFKKTRSRPADMDEIPDVWKTKLVW